MADKIISKICRTCKQTKAINEFYKTSVNRDGYRNQCKACSLQSSIRYNKSEKGRQACKLAQTNYWQSEKGKVARKHYQQSEKGKVAHKRHRKTEKYRKTKKQYQQNHPEQIKARNAVNNAITQSTLLSPDLLQCCFCPAKAKEYHHHKGYAPEHWLDVVPICIKCHNKLKT